MSTTYWIVAAYLCVAALLFARSYDRIRTERGRRIVQESIDQMPMLPARGTIAVIVIVLMVTSLLWPYFWPRNAYRRRTGKIEKW